MSLPQRIILQRTKGWRMPDNTVKVARPSRWGNPYTIGLPDIRCAETASIAWAMKLATLGHVDYRGYRITTKDIVQTLAGKNLACFCSGLWCHANRMLDIAAGRPPRLLVLSPDIATALDWLERMRGVQASDEPYNFTLEDGRVGHIATKVDHILGREVDGMISLGPCEELEPYGRTRVGRPSLAAAQRWAPA